MKLLTLLLKPLGNPLAKSLGLPLALVLALGGCAGEDGEAWRTGAGSVLEGVLTGGALGENEIALGLKEALRVGTDRVVDNLGQVDGFNADPKVHIPLPKVLAQAQSSLRLIGAAGLVDDLELRINRAAEQATPVAKDIFWGAITSLTFEDVDAIYRGPNDAATQYLDRTTRGSLNDAMRPIVDDALADAGAVAAYDSIIEQAKLAPFLPDLKTDLTNHVLGRAMDGMFGYLALEEAAIREDPLKRSTTLLKRVFGGTT
ncbi:MAG: DUF4197 domain-containing protein [Alphaproteobacteria bacterium]|nr:DUF4197 domain-containing protein [Alphaproteobacteria bacterium]